MISSSIDWVSSQLPTTFSVDIVLKIIFTIVLLLVGKRLHKMFFTPFYYDYDDPAMLIETPAERSKREIKARKKFGTLPPFPNGWYKLICSGELLPGQVKYVSALGKEYAVFRTMEGKPGIVGTYCPHLGADLSQGTVVGENLVCPFHAFHFDTKGTCTKIPYQENVPKGIKCQDVPTFVERNGAIHVWFDVDNREPDWELPDMLEGKGKLKFIGRTHHRVYTHVQEIHENGADNAHLPIVHRTTMLRLPVFWHEWGIKWAPSTEHKHMSDFTVNETIKIGNYHVPFTTFRVEGHHVGPGLVHFVFHTYLGPIYVAHQILPLEGFVQDSVYQVWGSKWIPLWFGKIIMTGWMQQFERDIVIWNQKLFLPAPQIVSNDGPIAQYRRWFKQFYSAQGTKKKFDLHDKDLF